VLATVRREGAGTCRWLGGAAAGGQLGVVDAGCGVRQQGPTGRRAVLCPHIHHVTSQPTVASLLMRPTPDRTVSQWCPPARQACPCTPCAPKQCAQNAPLHVPSLLRCMDAGALVGACSVDARSSGQNPSPCYPRALHISIHKLANTAHSSTAARLRSWGNLPRF
jgi:hypothetical protein